MSRPTILILAVRMARGFGVSVVVEELRVRWEIAGIRCVVGCLDCDEQLGAGTRIVAADPENILALAREENASAVVAATSPYFECLPKLASAGLNCWAYEHGDPTPMFFERDRLERQAIIDHKCRVVYPSIQGVIAISEFIRREIRWPLATVIPNGCDHIDDRGAKSLADTPLGRPARIKVGSLLRLGADEAAYKGRDVFLRMVRVARDELPELEWHCMGRGSEDDAKPYLQLGVIVHRNATDAERFDYLRSLDLFVSPSLWEGFNLPVVEAAAAGTPAASFDAGAHPEVTPLLFAGPRQFLGFLRCVASRPEELLPSWSVRCRRFVRERYSWDVTARQMAGLLLRSSFDDHRR